MNILDAFISWISPTAGARRMQARYAMEALTEARRQYEAGSVNRFNDRWLPIRTIDQENEERPQRDLIRTRAQWLEQNNDITNSIILAMIRNVINTGIRPQARTDNETLNADIERLFAVWAEPGNCDITGQMSFYEMQPLILRRKIVDGEIFVKLVTHSNEAGIPFQLQLIRSELLDSTLMKAPSGHVIRSGIELDDYLRPAAYWIERKTPDGYTAADPERVPAKNILHLWQKKYTDQIRGISDLAVIIDRLKKMDEYLSAETTAAFIAACFSVFITQNNLSVGIPNGCMPGGVNGKGKNQDKPEPLTNIRPGMITHLAPGEDVKAANPGRSATTAQEYINLHERMAGSGMGLSYEMTSRDFNSSSYSSARQGNLEDRRTFQPMQNWMITHFCMPVYRQFMDAAVLSGKLSISDYFQHREKYQQVEWIAPGWQSIDPLKEAQADILSLQNGLLTMSQQCAEHGSDWRDQITQMAKEKEYAETMGLKLSIHTPISVQAAESNHVGAGSNDGGEDNGKNSE